MLLKIKRVGIGAIERGIAGSCDLIWEMGRGNSKG